MQVTSGKMSGHEASHALHEPSDWSAGRYEEFHWLSHFLYEQLIGGVSEVDF